jgi:WLM domain
MHLFGRFGVLSKLSVPSIFDWFSLWKSIGVSSIFIVLLSIILYFRSKLLFGGKKRLKNSIIMNEKENLHDSCNTLSDVEVRRRAKEAAERRQNIWKKKQTQKKLNLQQHALIPQVELAPTPVIDSSLCDSMTMDEIVAASAPLFDDGIIIIRNMFQLPHADRSANMLRRLAHDFLPIIRQRGYNVNSVSEFCCCGDGMDYHLGGKSLSARPGTRIAGHDSENVMGYNRILHKCNARIGATSGYISSIHLRLRLPKSHSHFIRYEDLCENFCHELAHCVHHDHGPQFYALMRELQDQHAEILRKCL